MQDFGLDLFFEYLLLLIIYLTIYNFFFLKQKFVFLFRKFVLNVVTINNGIFHLDKEENNCNILIK